MKLFILNGFKSFAKRQSEKKDSQKIPHWKEMLRFDLEAVMLLIDTWTNPVLYFHF